MGRLLGLGVLVAVCLGVLGCGRSTPPTEPLLKTSRFFEKSTDKVPARR